MAEVLYNKKILPAYYRLGVSWEGAAVVPGQFIMLRITGQADPLLRRPFGVYKISGRGSRIKGQGIEILYRVVGKGTRLMTGLRPGDTVDILGPLGNGFPGPVYGSGENIIMVAGGIGIAPFYMIGASARGRGGRIKLLFGGRSEDDLPGLDDFKKLKIDISISTDDGSAGEKGFVTELLKKELKTQDSRLKTVVYACGSKGMLKEVSKITKKADIQCYVSLDQVMACGIGACLGCAVKVRSQESGVWSQNKSKIQNQKSKIYKMVCKDGPVFDAEEIEWEAI